MSLADHEVPSGTADDHYWHGPQHLPADEPDETPLNDDLEQIAHHIAHALTAAIDNQTVWRDGDGDIAGSPMDLARVATLALVDARHLLANLETQP